MHRLTLFLALALAARADLVEQGPQDSPPSGLMAGVARAAIAPAVGVPQLNWGSQTHVAAIGIDPAGMFATALVLSDGRQKFAMVDVDCLLIQQMDDAITRAAALTGIPAEHIRLAATHTHSAPAIQPGKGPPGIDVAPYQRLFDNYRQELKDKIVGAIVEANFRLRPAHLYGGRGVGTININRRVRARDGMPAAVGRNPDGFVDRELAVFRIDDAQGKPLAVLANFQCHGTVLAYENKYISPDWIGMARRTVEEAMPGALCLYFQGAAGNQGPLEGFTGDLGVAHRLGAILGHEIAAVALSIETVRREPRFEGFVESTAYQAKQHWRVLGPRDATMKFARALIEVPRRQYSSVEIEDMKRSVAGARQKSEAAKASGDAWQRYQADARLRRFSDLLAKWSSPPDPTPLAVEVRILRIGEVAIVAMPGEPFAEIGAAVKKASPFAVTMFCGYSSGQGGDYMPIASEYALGGYEVQRTPYGPGAAEKIIRGTIALFKGVQ